MIVGYDKEKPATTELKTRLSSDTPGVPCVRLYAATPGSFCLQIRGNQKGNPWYATAMLPRAEIENMIRAVNAHGELLEAVKDMYSAITNGHSLALTHKQSQDLIASAEGGK